MTVTFYPDGLPDSLDKRPCYYAVNPYPTGYFDAEFASRVRNYDRLGALYLAYQKHQDWLNYACDRGVLPENMRTRQSASVCTIVSGLRVVAHRLKLANGQSTFYPVFVVTMSGLSGEFKKRALRVFFPCKAGYKEAWEEAVIHYAADRMLSPEIERMLFDLIPSQSLFIDYLAPHHGINDPLDMQVFTGRLQPNKSLRIRTHRSYAAPYIIASGLRGCINRINTNCVTLAFVARTKHGSFRHAALLKHGYEGAYRRAVDAYMDIHSDAATEDVREQLLSMMPDKTVFSDHLIPLMLKKGRITEVEAAKLLNDLKAS